MNASIYIFGTILALSFAVMFVDKSKYRWPAIVQYISGAVLASGILFRAA